MTDLSAASEEDVKAFFRLYYAPNNATLAVVGDFDPKQTKAWIQKYFSDLPQGKTVERPKVPLGKLGCEQAFGLRRSCASAATLHSVADSWLQG